MHVLGHFYLQMKLVVPTEIVDTRKASLQFKSPFNLTTNGDQRTPPIQCALAFCACTVWGQRTGRFFCTVLHAEKQQKIFLHALRAEKVKQQGTATTTTLSHSPLARSSPANLPAYLPLCRRRHLLLSAALLLIHRRLQRVGLTRTLGTH